MTDGTGDRRAEILEAAVVVCAAGGVGGATLREIADRAGMTKGLLTYYFPTKDELVAQAVLGIVQRFDDAVDGWLGDDDAGPDVRLHRWLRGHAGLTLRHVDHVRVRHESVTALGPDRRRAIDAVGERYATRLGDLVDACRPVLPIADHPTAALVRSALGVLDWPYHWFDPTADADGGIDAVADCVADRALAVLLATPGPGTDDR